MHIYVETLIRGSLEDLWTKTQTPNLHQQWDLRFTEIEYLPRLSAEDAQRFLYKTRIGFGMQIAGEGETTGSAEIDGSKTSALRFWSEDRKSLIREGSGYWKYIKVEDGTRFLTLYDYQARFGVFGRLFDRAIFKPLLGWATAWSFDRLRIWIEKGIPPDVLFQRWLCHAITRIAVAFIWIYQGLIPKLLFQSNDEMAMILSAGFSPGFARDLLTIAGVLEIAFGLLILIAWHSRRLFSFTIFLMISSAILVAFTSPAFTVAAFNPITLNLAVTSLSVVGLLNAANIPSAGKCLRKAPHQNAIHIPESARV